METRDATSAPADSAGSEDSEDGQLVVVAADLTWVRVNGGRGFAQLSNWDHDDPPQVGQHVLAADGGSERLSATILEIRPHGTLVLDFPSLNAPASAAPEA